MIFELSVFSMLLNPNNLAFWAWWGMLSIVILMKSWNKILRFKYDMETSRWISKESDEEIISIYNEHRDMNKKMLEKYPDWTPINKYYHDRIISEYNKRGLQNFTTVSRK